MVKTVVIKIGSSTLTTPRNQLDLANLKRLVREVAGLVRQKHRVVIVTSGAIVTGAEKLKLGRPKSIPEKQAAAAVGQSILMRQYEKAFEAFGIPVAQILLTKDIMAHDERRTNAYHCFHTLLNEGVVPIVNENDTVAIDEIKIGDNDNLAALTAELIKADLLILLTDVAGFYRQERGGKKVLVAEIKKITPALKIAAGQTATNVGTGGMITKLQAAQLCLKSGITMVIAHGRQAGALRAIAAGQKIGTTFGWRR